MSFPKLAASAIAIAAIAGAASAQDRQQIRIVGSSTVFPFSTAVAEQFGRTTDFGTPVVESTGSGGGIKLFCEGVGTQTPDIANASRRMKASELQTSMDNGVTEVTEVLVGYDGIVVANAAGAPRLDLTLEQLTLALAANGPMPSNWSDVDPALPDVAIEVLGPPPSSGTRDAFEELVMEVGCESLAEVECEGLEIRTDGAYVESGENDNLIVSKLEENSDAVGIFGFSFLDQNMDALQGASIGGVEPTFDNIASGDYPVSRSLQFYLKNAHVGVVPGIQEYAQEFVSDAAGGDMGYLTDLGLIPLNAELLSEQQDKVSNLTPLSMGDLEGQGS